MMNRDEALKLLRLEPAVNISEIQSVLVSRVTELEVRAREAPTEALREKYKAQLSELELARQALLSNVSPSGGLSQTKIADLPVVQSSYSGHGSAPASSMAVGAVSLSPGQVLSSRYEIIEQIGIGGMGAVYRAFDKNREKDIAIKVLLPHLLVSPGARDRFLSEARLASEMSHPNIVTVFDVQIDGPFCLLTMELLRGETLRTALSRHKQQRRLMPVEDALRVADQISQALAYAHDKTVHRDIKPENIWLGDDGRAKLMDFGIARLLTEGPTQDSGQSAGTAYYMAPEQLAGHPDVDGRADQYALAATLYEMIAGHVPTGRIESLEKVRSGVPQAVSIAVDKALSPRVEQRYPGMTAFREALHKAPSKSPFSSRKSVIVVACLAGALVIAGALWSLMGDIFAERAAEEKAQREAARLQGESKAILRQIEAIRRDLKDGVVGAAREVERIDGQLKSAKSEAERSQIQASLVIARSKADTVAEIESTVRARLDSTDGLTAVEGLMASAEALLKEKKLVKAYAELETAVSALQKLRSLPDTVRQDIEGQRKKLIGTLEGKWGSACDTPSVWSVKGEQVQVYWPSIGMFEAVITHATKGVVSATVLSPASYKGRSYRYLPEASRMAIEEVGSDRRLILQRCN